ncbi:MAG: cytochrome c [Polyangiaceae bacterium]
MTGVAGALSFAGCSGEDHANAVGVDASVALDAGRDAATTDADAAPDADFHCTSAPDAAIYSADLIDAGADLVENFGCHGCHLGDLSGSDMPIGLNAFARNLTPDPITGLGCWTDDQIARAIRFGIDDEGEQLCVMPQFGGSIDEAGAIAVVAYLRSIPPVVKDDLPTSCPKDAGGD